MNPVWMCRQNKKQFFHLKLLKFGVIWIGNIEKIDKKIMLKLLY